MQEALNFGNQNAFLTRKVWHKNTGHDTKDRGNSQPAGERYSSGVVILDNSEDNGQEGGGGGGGGGGGSGSGAGQPGNDGHLTDDE